MGPIQIKPHPVQRSTELPINILKRREWILYGYYADYLTFGHYLDKLFPEGDFLNLRCGYGTLGEALLANTREVLCTDIDEEEIATLTAEVRNNFRVIDELSPSLKLGTYTTVLVLDSIDYENDEDFMLYVNFIARHAAQYILILIDDIIHSYDDWVYIFNKHGFEFCTSKLETIMNELEPKLKIINLSNLLIFERKEIIHAWSREDA